MVGSVAAMRIDETSAWQALAAHAAQTDFDLRQLFAADPERVDRLSFDAADLELDFSKHLVDDTTVSLLLQLAEEAGVADRFAAMRTGERRRRWRRDPRTAIVAADLLRRAGGGRRAHRVPRPRSPHAGEIMAEGLRCEHLDGWSCETR